MGRSSFAVGDRVQERGRIGLDVVTPLSPNYKQVCAIRHGSRRGQVVGFQTKLDRRGRHCTYVNVIWDGSSSPSQHAVGRLSLED
jgi:hypothetical protein